MSDGGTHNQELAKGAGLAFLGRLGALIEAISLPVFAWLYGPATLGIFFALWAALRILTAISDFAMTTSLQRFIAEADNNGSSGDVLRLALTTGLAISLSIALSVTFFAADIAPLFNASIDDSAHLVAIIQLYVWVLPAWTLVEILTAAVRAKRAFGPEIRVRIFYEQGLRLIAAVGFFFLGYQSMGLFYAHLASVLLAALLALRLALKHYNLKGPQSPANASDILSFAAHMMPANLVKKLNSELPTLMLNMLLPGATGAVAAGLFGVARKVASILQVFRQSFEYVLAPFAAQKSAEDKHDELEDMFALSLRLTAVFLLPVGLLVAGLRHEVLLIFSPEFTAAGSALGILALGRIAEGMSGPSSAIIEMLGHKALPLINGAAGIGTLITLQLYLVPELGLAGAAIAAAAGLNVVSLLSLAQSIFIYKLNPFSRAVLRPIMIAFLGIAATIAIIIFLNITQQVVGVAMVITGGIATLLAAIRFGLSAEDQAALGPIGRPFRRK